MAPDVRHRAKDAQHQRTFYGIWLLYNPSLWPICSRWLRTPASPGGQMHINLLQAVWHSHKLPRPRFCSIDTQWYILLQQLERSFPSWLAHRLPKYLTAPSHHPYTRMQCPVSQVPKYSELLISHRSSLRSKGHLYPYPSRDYSLAEERTADGHYSVWCTIHPPVCHASVNPWHSLVKRTTNQHGHTTTYTRYIVIPGNWYILWSRTRFKNHNDKSSLYHTNSSSRDSLLKNSFQEEQSNEQPFIMIHSHLQDPISTSQMIGFRAPFPTHGVKSGPFRIWT